MATIRQLLCLLLLLALPQPDLEGRLSRAQQEQAYFEESTHQAVHYVEHQRRLETVSYNLRKASLGIGEPSLDFGFTLHSLGDYIQSFGEEVGFVVARSFDAIPSVTIKQVMPNSPAKSLGLKPGDRVLRINGKDTRTLTTPEVEDMITPLTKKENGHLNLAVARDFEVITMTIEGTTSSRQSVELIDTPTALCFLDGERVQVSTGMMDLLADNSELSVVLSHNIAHNLLNHLPSHLNTLTWKTLVGRTFAFDFSDDHPGVFSSELEDKADKVGLTIAARAGYDVSKAERVWALFQLSAEDQQPGSFASQHPLTDERSRHIGSVVRTIEEKRARNIPIMAEGAELETNESML